MNNDLLKPYISLSSDLSSDQIALMSFLEQKFFHMWPSSEVNEFGGWLLRYDPSVSYRRCNSAYASLKGVTEPLDSLLDHVYHEYTKVGKTPFIYTTTLSYPSNLQQKLRESNRAHFSLRTDVMVIQEPAKNLKLQKSVVPAGLSCNIINHEDAEEMADFLIPYFLSFDKKKE